MVLLFFSNVIADVDPETLRKTADTEIFNKAPFKQTFSEKQGYVNEFLENEILHQYYINNGKGSDVLTSLQPCKSDISSTNKRIKFDDRPAKNFHVKYTVRRNESVPDNSGYCWIRYSDKLYTGTGKENGIVIYPGYKAFSFSHVDSNIQLSEISDLSEFKPKKDIVVEIIRLDGVSYVYLNKTFVFQYEDGITNSVTIEGGSMLNKGGNRIQCDFDDFIFTSK